MLHQKQQAPVTAELLGDLRPLIEQLGSPAGLAALTCGCDNLSSSRITNQKELRIFLQNYHKLILQPLELPAIQSAFNHARRNELRELIACDRGLRDKPILEKFAVASRHAGLSQLLRLRPLRDERIVQRYLAAVERGEAHGWHTLVYGLALAVYSLPLRQGLIGYAHQTTRSFLQSAARSLTLSEADVSTIHDELSTSFQQSVEALLAQSVIA